LKETKGIESRRLALEALIQVDKQGMFADNALATAFKRKQLSSRDRAFVTALVLGVIRHKGRLDDVIKELSHQPFEKLPVPLLNTLRLGIFQLEQMPDIPPSAVLNTCAELAKALGHIGQARFVNGFLRNFLRTIKTVTDDDKQTRTIAKARKSTGATPSKTKGDDSEHLSKTYSMPGWIVKRWMNTFGHSEALKLLQIAQEPGKLTLRTCTTAITVEGLIGVLNSRGFTVRVGSLVPTCLIIEGSPKSKSLAGPPQSIPGFADGLFSIQDEASAFVSIVVDPKPGELIVDLCAAPGSKTTHLGELTGGTGQVIAVDKNAKRLELIRENRARLGLTNIQAREGDSRTFTLSKQADRVLLDAPCMGTGVIGRRPDIRYHRSESDLKELVNLQRELLDNAATLVKPGGSLIYSTCSLEPEENIENMRWFLENHKEFKPISLVKHVPSETLEQWRKAEREAGLDQTTESNLSNGFVQLLPSRHGVSGFFVCRMDKEAVSQF
jgi:16S rRNA (cytosine967-C5)-methyltransferase